MIKFRDVLVLVAALAAINASSAAEQSIVLASTTSVEASGLLANILPRFTAKTGITVNVVAQGTGKALDTARRGDADLLLVHDPEAEAQFMAEGHGRTPRNRASALENRSPRPRDGKGKMVSRHRWRDGAGAQRRKRDGRLHADRP